MNLWCVNRTCKKIYFKIIIHSLNPLNMNTKIFVNLPVKDLNRSMNFFKSMGYTFNPQFTDETAACLVISEDIYAMLLTHEKFKSFTSKEIADSSKTTEVLVALSTDSREKVNELVDKALSAGATKARDPEDYGFMYQRSFNDPDGHTWEILWMDPSYITQEQVTDTTHVAENI